MRKFSRLSILIIGIIRAIALLVLAIIYLINKEFGISIACAVLLVADFVFGLMGYRTIKEGKPRIWLAMFIVVFVSVLGGSTYLLYDSKKERTVIPKLPLNGNGKTAIAARVGTLDIIIAVILVSYAFLIIFPFWNAFVISISSESAYLHSTLLLWPTELDLSSYKSVFTNQQLWSGFGITMILLIFGTTYQLFFTVITGYALSRKNWTGKNFLMNMILVTMFFGGGLIPYYYLIRDLGMMNTIWVMIIPGAIDTFNMLLMRNYFASLPSEMEESAKIDGANDIIIFVRIFLPLSLPMLATIGLFFAVGNWNSWYNAMMFMPDNSKIWPLQMVLRTMISKVSSNIENPDVREGYSEGLTMASIFFTIVPMMCFYPFLQRFFVKGIVVGAIKG